MTNQIESNKSKLMFLTAMFIFGSIGIFRRYIPLPSGTIAMCRGFIGVVFLILAMLVLRKKFSKTAIKANLLVLCISGALIGFNWIFLFEAYRYTTVSVATLSYYFAPVIVTLVCPILFREKLTGKQLICFAMSTLGIVMITGIGEVGGEQGLIGILFGLGAAMLYAFVVLLNKFIKNVEGIHRTFLQFLAAIVVLIPYVMLTSGVTLGSMNLTGWVNLLVVGLVHTGITYCMYFSSLEYIPGQKAAILSYIDPLVAVLVSVTVLREAMTLWQATGGLLILGFTLWNEIPSKK